MIHLAYTILLLFTLLFITQSDSEDECRGLCFSEHSHPLSIDLLPPVVAQDPFPSLSSFTFLFPLGRLFYMPTKRKARHLYKVHKEGCSLKWFLIEKYRKQPRMSINMGINKYNLLYSFENSWKEWTTLSDGSLIFFIDKTIWRMIDTELSYLDKK